MSEGSCENAFITELVKGRKGNIKEFENAAQTGKVGTAGGPWMIKLKGGGGDAKMHHRYARQGKARPKSSKSYWTPTTGHRPG